MACSRSGGKRRENNIYINIYMASVKIKNGSEIGDSLTGIWDINKKVRYCNYLND